MGLELLVEDITIKQYMELTPEQKQREAFLLEEIALPEKLRKEEKEFARIIREKILESSTEDDFLQIIEELQKNSKDIKDTVGLSSKNDLYLKFGDTEYNVKIFIKPRKTHEKDDGIEYFLYISKN